MNMQLSRYGQSRRRPILEKFTSVQTRSPGNITPTAWPVILEIRLEEGRPMPKLVRIKMMYSSVLGSPSHTSPDVQGRIEL
jgi:hypothetical protein